MYSNSNYWISINGFIKLCKEIKNLLEDPETVIDIPKEDDRITRITFRYNKNSKHKCSYCEKTEYFSSFLVLRERTSIYICKDCLYSFSECYKNIPEEIKLTSKIKSL